MYKLTETAPAQGYTNAADEYLKVDAAGNLLVSDAADGTFSPYANPDLVVSDAQNVFSIAKVNGGGAALSGRSSPSPALLLEARLLKPDI